MAAFLYFFNSSTSFVACSNDAVGVPIYSPTFIETVMMSFLSYYTTALFSLLGFSAAKSSAFSFFFLTALFMSHSSQKVPSNARVWAVFPATRSPCSTKFSVLNFYIIFSTLITASSPACSEAVTGTTFASVAGLCPPEPGATATAPSSAS